MADHELFSELLKEADAVLDCTGRRWIRDENLRYTDSFVLHGIQTGALNESNVWRLSPRAGSASLHFSTTDDAGLNVTGGDMLALDWCLGFPACTAGEPQLSAVTLQFEGGAVLPSPTTPSIATGGVWITQPANCTWCVRVAGHSGQQTSWPIPTGVH